VGVSLTADPHANRRKPCCQPNNGRRLRLTEKAFPGPRTHLRRHLDGRPLEKTLAAPPAPSVAESPRPGDPHPSQSFPLSPSISSTRARFWDIVLPIPSQIRGSPRWSPPGMPLLGQRREVRRLSQRVQLKYLLKSANVLPDTVAFAIRPKSDRIAPELSNPMCEHRLAAPSVEDPRNYRATAHASKPASSPASAAALNRRNRPLRRSLQGGLSSPQRTQYAEGFPRRIAVPSTPGTGAIFVPIRIVFSQAIPTAGPLPPRRATSRPIRLTPPFQCSGEI